MTEGQRIARASADPIEHFLLMQEYARHLRDVEKAARDTTACTEESDD